jgi:general secretion pathway protein A
MYESFFGFRERPFDLSPDPRYLVFTDAHREALSNLQYAIASRKGISLLIGEAGTGKTTIIRAAIERQPDRAYCVHLQNPALSRAEFIEMLAARFELGDRPTTSKTALLMEMEALLTTRRARGEATVLIIDEAQALPLELLEEIRLLANIETDQQKLLTVILAGQPELADRLNEKSLRQLKQRIALRCELGPLTLQESCGYIAGRIRAAGGVGSQTFTREAVMLIHERAAGIPRTLNVIADNALLNGFAMEQRPVTSKTVLEVCDDLDLRTDASSAPPPRAAVRPTPAEPARSNRLITFEPTPASSAGGTADPTEEIERGPRLLDTGTTPKRRRFSIF